MKAKPNISKAAFWDVDFEKIDYEKNSQYVISQAFNFGTLDDMIAVLKYYGDKKVREEVVSSSWLNERAVSFLSNYFGLQKEDFACYMKKQLITGLW